MSNKKLFAVYVGGDTSTSHIELHDMRFAVADKIENAYDDLIAQWWGTPESLHLDAWGALVSADGHNIVLKDHPAPKDQPKLYFVNLGGYDVEEFTELHKNVFVVGVNASKAKVSALRHIQHWKSPHKDALFEVEKLINLNEIAEKHGLYVHLEATENPVPFKFICKYVQIGKAP